MAIFRTTQCCKFKHPEVILNISDEARADMRWLLDFFERAVADGRQFKANQTVQIGWMITQLREDPEGNLEVWEPQFGPIPIQWIKKVDKTLRHLSLQKSVAGLFQLEPEFPPLIHAGSVTTSFWSESGSLFMARENASQSYSGWQFSKAVHERSAGELHSLFAVASKCPMVVPFLALPPGAVVKYSGEEITIEYKNRTVSPSDNKLLNDIVQSRSLIED